MTIAGSTLEKEPSSEKKQATPGEYGNARQEPLRVEKEPENWPPAPEEESPSDIIPLKTRGLVFIGVLICYAAFLTGYSLSQKETLFDRFIEMDKAYEAEWELRQADLSIINSLMTISADMESLDLTDVGTSHIRDNLKLIKAKFDELSQSFPDSAFAFTALSAGLDAAIKKPSKHNLMSLRKTLGNVRSELGRLVASRQDKLNTLVENYRNASEDVTTNVLGLGLLGIALTVIMAGLFFTRLTDDIRALEKRAGEIITGARGGPVGSSVTARHDEVGQLGLAIERMASALDQRERELEIERKKMLHREKMAAIGTLAAGIAHEVGNPIAAISALVNETRKEQIADGAVCVNERCKGNLDFILHHTERLATITREISAFATPQHEDRRLLDINGIARSASSLMRYDKRFAQVDLQLNLDSQLPAVSGVGDQLLQVIMNLLINASDAVADVEDRPKMVTLTTAAAGEGMVTISVSDNGHGMDRATMDHAFEAFFTTKPVGKGTGLGLSLCHSIISNHGGTIDIDSTPGEGASIKILLPVDGIKKEQEA